jgi:cardiolipin synthase
VNAASKANYDELLKAGVEIYLYEKGFVHAKTMITDGKLSMIGTANMDYRSFDLNFEVNAIVYDVPFSEKLRTVFFDDLEHAKKINEKLWSNRAFYYKLGDRIARLFSPAL